MSLNVVALCGRLTTEPVLRKTQSGSSVVNFKLAVDRDIKKDNEQSADFIPIQVWNRTADNVAKYCIKGSRVNVKGRIQTRTYDGTDGKKVYVTEVVAESVQFLESKGSTQSNGNEQTGEYSPQTETSATGFANEDMSMIDNDDLPF